MGAFNDWVIGTGLEPYQNRKVAVVAESIMQDAAVLWRLNALKMQGVSLAHI